MNEGIRQTLYSEKKIYPTVVQYMDGSVSSIYLSGTTASGSIPNKGNATYVKLSKSVTGIGNYTFQNSYNLLSVDIPDSVG